MKKILTLFALILTFGLSAQSTTSIDTTTSIGDQFIKFEKQYSGGKTLQFVGIGVAIFGSCVVSAPIVLIGGVVWLVGEFVEADSHKYMRIVGVLMNKNNIGVNINKIE